MLLIYKNNVDKTSVVPGIFIQIILYTIYYTMLYNVKP